MNTLENALCTRVDKGEDETILPMKLEFHLDALYLTYVHQGLTKCEQVQPFSVVCDSYYWICDIDGAELYRAIKGIENYDLVFHGGTLAVVDKNKNEMSFITPYQWDDFYTFLGFDPETQIPHAEIDFSFSIDSSNFKSFLSAARAAKQGNGVVYVQTVRSSKLIALSTFGESIISYHSCFSSQEPKDMHFAIPAIAIDFFEDETSSIRFNFCPLDKTIWLTSVDVMARCRWDETIAPSLDALPERQSKSIELNIEDLAQALNSVAETKSVAGVFNLDSPDINQVHLFSKTIPEPAFFVSGKKGVKKIEISGSIDIELEIVVCAIALTDILQGMSSQDVRIKMPLNRITPLTLQCMGELYQLFGIESEPFDGMTYQDIRSEAPQPTILYRAGNEDGSELNILRVEESLLQPRFSIDEICDQEFQISYNWDTSSPERMKFHSVIEQITEVHYVLIEIGRRLEALYQDDPSPIGQNVMARLYTRIANSHEIVHQSNMSLAHNGGFKLAYLEAHLQDAIWFGGQVLKVLNRQKTSYQLKLSVH